MGFARLALLALVREYTLRPRFSASVRGGGCLFKGSGLGKGRSSEGAQLGENEAGRQF